MYMQDTTDPNLLKWWAQYIESTGDMESAFKVYQKADDWFSQVRILCFLGQLANADSVARLSGDKAACYHLARHYENINKIQESIQVNSLNRHVAIRVLNLLLCQTFDLMYLNFSKDLIFTMAPKKPK